MMANGETEVAAPGPHMRDDGLGVEKNGVTDDQSLPLKPKAGWQFDASYWGDLETAEEQEGLRESIFDKARVVQGDSFGELIKMKSMVRGCDLPAPAETIEELDLHPTLKDNIIKYMKYKELTPVQKCVIPAIEEGRDLMACSHTGTGKTASYMIPIVDRLLKAGREKCADNAVVRATGLLTISPRVLILSPTRELTTQIFNEARKFSYGTWIRPTAIYGGVHAQPLLTRLHRGSHILCATLGKLVDFLDTGKISLSKIQFLVIDEADKLIHDGDSSDVIQRILRQYDLPSDESKQISIFSATFPEDVRATAASFLIDPIFITVENVASLPKNLEQKVIHVEDKNKFNTLLDILHNQVPGQTLVFVNSCTLVDTIDDALYRRNFPVTSIHGKRTQAEREDALSAFRSNKTPIMIATSVASRGLDIPSVVHVINYDMPKDLEDYVHRVGRTARVGNKGLATTFYNEGNESMARTLANTLKKYKQEVPHFLEPYLLLDKTEGEQEPDVLDCSNAEDPTISTEFGMLLKKLGSMDMEDSATTKEATKDTNEVAGAAGDKSDDGGW